ISGSAITQSSTPAGGLSDERVLPFDQADLLAASDFITCRNNLLMHYMSSEWAPPPFAEGQTHIGTKSARPPAQDDAHNDFRERGTHLLHLILAARKNPTVLLKACITMEMMGNNGAYETTFRSDSVHLQVIFEFWRLSLLQYLPEWKTLQE